MMQDSKSEPVYKTLKLFIGGEFPRTESGRSFPIMSSEQKKVLANLCQASRKDMRQAVASARSASAAWSASGTYLRGQILYRWAEMLSARQSEIVDLIVAVEGKNLSQAEKIFEEMISTIIHFAGFADKYQQILSCQNSVSGPHHNISHAEALGVIGLTFSENCSLTFIAGQIAAALVPGNSIVVCLDGRIGSFIAVLAETLATSDLPGGVVNILTGKISELMPPLAGHMEVNGISLCGEGIAPELTTQAKRDGTENMKRIFTNSKQPIALEGIEQGVEIKTVWHPVSY